MREREKEGWDKGGRADEEREKGGKTRVRAEKPTKRTGTDGVEKKRLRGFASARVFPSSVLHHPDSRPIIPR